ncbi:MAG: 1-acyl-sn-glycerol-3-phosphate acyltransferase [Eubacteriales bacterium]|nr:1-acyl-sn-glycerol-3-phosphate acyltransferase [Eubacteriales bacterium]
MKSQSVLKFFFGWIFRLFFPVRVVRREDFYTDGAVMVVCNHIHLLDPALLVAHHPKPVSFMAKKELFASRFGNWLFGRMLGAVPVDRDGADVAAMKTLIRRLKNGEVVGVFPEGTRHRDGRMGEFHSGAALMALRTGATIQPVAYTRSIRLFRRTTLVVGQPLDLSDLAGQRVTREMADEVTRRVRDAIAALRATVTTE